VSGTRIASISGLRGVVGDGLDPVVAVEFAAAYASNCERGPIIVSHDGRISSTVFVPAVVAGVTATGRDAQVAGAAATPTVGILVKERSAAGGIQISASHNPPQYNGLKFFQPGGMVLSPEQGRGVLDRWQRKDLAWAAWDGLGKTRSIEEPDEIHLERVLAIVDVQAIRRRQFPVALDACHGAGGRLAARLLRTLGCRPIVLGAEPDGHYDHLPEPTERNLRSFSAMVAAMGAAVGFAQDPDADRLAIVDESGRYIGEGFDDARLDTLFLALPVSWKGTLIQYTGRLHRLHPGKIEVCIFDYVDRDVPMLLRMFEKRLRGYRAIGYARREAPLGYAEPAGEVVVEYDEDVLRELDARDEFT